MAMLPTNAGHFCPYLEALNKLISMKTIELIKNGSLRN